MELNRLSSAIVELARLVGRLRSPGGCPWDARQTDSTIKMYLLEEAYEVLEAVEGSSPMDVCQELGDLLFQILFLAQLAAEREEFDFTDVVEGITEKMIHRHPHVFGGVSVETAEDVALNWAKIKREEKKEAGRTTSQLDGVPEGLPALSRAHRLSERATRADAEGAGADEVWDRVVARFEGLGAVITDEDRELAGREIGELLFGLADLTRNLGLNAENLLRLTNREFVERFKEKERDKSQLPSGKVSAG